jgi:hypothetical protein
VSTEEEKEKERKGKERKGKERKGKEQGKGKARDGLMSMNVTIYHHSRMN